MSKEITCKECGYTNPHSSKFCNNCGAKLPLSTHIICPNCETPNTRDRVFCDTCGTRLIPEATQIKPEEPPEDAPPKNQPFSLPARRPGDTGELNPNAVPDWLRTGDIGSAKEPGADAEDEDDKEDPKGASDLPDWLVHDSDPEPIINAPTTISTEFYQDLVDKAEDLPQPDDLFPDDEDTELPDWLSEAATIRAENEDDSEASAGLTDWLDELDDESKAEETAVSPQSSDDLSSGLTDWLHELDDLNNLAEDHQEENAAALNDLLHEQANEEADSSAWVQELGPVQTDLFPQQTDDAEAEKGEDMPGWMDELGPLQTNLLDPSQIAELTGPLSGISDDAEIVDDEEAGTDVSFTQLFETASEETETLPDWLDAAGDEPDTFLSDLPADLIDETEAEPEVVSEPGSDWFTADQIVAETDLDWLEETGNLEKVAEGDALDDWMASDAQPQAEADDEPSLIEDDFGEDADEEPAGPPLLSSADEDDFDWLADMEAIQTGELAVEPEPAEPLPAIPAEAEPDLPDEIEPEDEPEPEEESWSSDSFLPDTAVQEDLPDWLNQLDDVDVKEEAGDDALDAANEELPDWIASMRPSEGFVGSELPGVFSEIDLRDTLEGIPEELAGAELPDWLRDTPLDSAPPTPYTESDKERPMEIPDWLQPKDEQVEGAAPAPTSPGDPPEGSSSRSEWRSLLDELPPLTPLAEALPKADIPEWVQELKPPELSGDLHRKPEGPEETVGPLKGMQGVITIEPTIAKPRTALLPTPYLTTPEQQQQVALLRQLTQAAPESVTTLKTSAAYDTAVWLRITLAILVIAAVILGLLGPNLVSPVLSVPAHVRGMENAIAAAAGQPVLVAIEYTPAMAGELSPQAAMLLSQLAANGSPVLFTSQYAAGTAVASQFTVANDDQMVGYLPGEGVGLRQLGDCLAARNDCAQLNGRQLSTELQTSLSQTGLVIVLTGDRDNLVNWIEQVGTVANGVPLVAGVTQALTPLANSYAAASQLNGLLGGTPDAVAYEQLVTQPETNLNSFLNAQIYAQLLVGILLLIGLITYTTRGWLAHRQQGNA